MYEENRELELHQAARAEVSIVFCLGNRAVDRHRSTAEQGMISWYVDRVVRIVVYVRISSIF